MKTKFFLTAFILFFFTSLFAQLVRRPNTIQKTTVANSAIQTKPVKTTSTPMQEKAQVKSPVATVVSKNLIFLNKRDKGSAAQLHQKINPGIQNISVRGYAYTKDIRYSDGTVVHLRLTKNPAVTGQATNLKVSARQTGQDQNSGYNCITSNVSLTATSTDFMDNDYGRQAAHIYPGAIYTYDNLYDGSFREETANRNPIIVGCDNPNMSSPTYQEVINPNQNNIHDALAKLYSRFSGVSANGSLAYQVFESANNSDLNIKVGAGGSGYGFTFNNVFNTSEQEKHVYLTIDARKSLFTMSAALPDSGYFKTAPNGSSPLVIMGSVTYGIRILANMEFTFLSKSDADNFKAQYSGYGFTANVNLDFLSKSSAASSTVNAYVVGGPGSNATISFDKSDLEQKVQSILSGATYQNAAPISYELYDMNGIVIGDQSATDQFTERNCVPADIPTNLQNPQVSIISGDDGKDNDTHYTLELFNSNGQEAAIYVNNSNGDEYAKYESVPVEMSAGTPTGEIKLQGSLPLPVMRPPTLEDFAKNGGRIHITITPNGHDTWKIQNFKIILNFQGQKPHTIQWSNKTLSQDSREKDLMFDNGFNAVQ